MSRVVDANRFNATYVRQSLTDHRPLQLRAPLGSYLSFEEAAGRSESGAFSMFWECFIDLTQNMCLRIFFATDIQGSEICFRKLLSAGKFYGAEVVIMGGDMTGKMIVPIIRVRGGTYVSYYRHREIKISSEAEARGFAQKMRDVGFYPYLTDTDEMELLRRNDEYINSVFRRLMVETLERWVELADERLKGSGTRFFILPGNDDDYCIDTPLARSAYMVNLEGRVLELDKWHEIMSTGFSNPTPWHTPRERSEQEMEVALEELASRLKNPHSSIFNIHVPPFNSGIDECAELNENLKVITEGGYVITKPAGSKAVRSIIEKYQPLVGLFGHIHEGRGFAKIGETLCLNPGSSYQEGTLNGCLISLKKGQIQHFQLTTG